MVKVQDLLGHVLVILGLMFLVFLVLDQYNPMMNFINNNISRTLLALFCVCGIARSIYDWYMEEKSL